MDLLVGLMLVTAAAGTAAAGELVVTAKPRDPVLTGRELVVSARDASDPTRSHAWPMRAGGAASFRVDEGTWLVTIATPGLWSPARAVEVHEGAAARVDLPVLPTGTVRARLVLPAKPPAAVKVHFQQSTDIPDADLAGEHIALGQPDGDRVELELPAGTFDLAFRISGYSSVFRWDQKIAAKEVRDLGALAFRKGTTISGRVDIGSVPKSDLKNLRVVLRPQERSFLDEPRPEKVRLQNVTAEPTPRGFFDFAVQPGAYAVQAIAGRYRSEERTLEVTDKAEAVLTAALRLEEPRTLRVHVEPVLDPTGKPWHVTLTGLTGPVTRPLSATGFVEFEDLLALPYRIDVGRGAGDAWHSESVDLRDVSSVDITIPLTRITGFVLLGDAPIAGATLSFVDGDRLIRVRSRAEGRFAVDLPIEEVDAVWKKVEIEASEPLIRAAVEDVRIENGEATIRIPDRTILGETRDTEGRLAPAMVSVHVPSGLFQVESQEGLFTVHGVPAGPISLEAFSTTGAMTARAVEVVLSEDEDASANVRLVLEGSDQFRGVVRAPHGPLTAASVWCAASMLPPLVMRVATDFDGAFHFAKPRSVEQMTCTVAAPTFATRLFRTSAARSEPLPVFMTQAGAMLTVTIPPPDEGRRAFLLHGNATIPATSFAYLASVRGDGSAFTAYVEEGDWSLCRWTDAEAAAAELGAPLLQRCKSTRAVPGGSAELRF
jgi:hypothetical protein